VGLNEKAPKPFFAMPRRKMVEGKETSTGQKLNSINAVV